MLEVGWPDPALVDERIESTRSCAARSETVSRPGMDVTSVVLTDHSLAVGARCRDSHSRIVSAPDALAAAGVPRAAGYRLRSLPLLDSSRQSDSDTSTS